MKFLNSRVLIISFITFLLTILIYLNYLQKEKNVEVKELEIEENNFSNSNIIKDIQYSSQDLKGNEYIILANEGEIDLNNSDIIFLKNVKAYINLIKNKQTIKIFSDFGKYNTITYDTIFSKNVKIEYLDSNITGDYLDFSMNKNILIISKNVVYTGPDNILKADVVELNTITKDTKIFMHNTMDQVKIESRN